MDSEIRRARSETDFATAKRLIEAYADELGVDLGFQNFNAEIADLEGTYETILLAGADGCVALKRHNAARCEMKRLYVRPDARGTGLGESLTVAIIETARRAGYREMLLDTMQRLGAAVLLYEKLGFRRCAPFYNNPEPDAVYMRLAL